MEVPDNFVSSLLNNPPDWGDCATAEPLGREYFAAQIVQAQDRLDMQRLRGEWTGNTEAYIWFLQELLKDFK